MEGAESSLLACKIMHNFVYKLATEHDWLFFFLMIASRMKMVAGELGCGGNDNSPSKVRSQFREKDLQRGEKLQNGRIAKCISISDMISWEGEVGRANRAEIFPNSGKVL